MMAVMVASGLGGLDLFGRFGFVMTIASDRYDDDEITRRAEAALLRALSTPHKRQSEMKIGKRKVARMKKALIRSEALPAPRVGRTPRLLRRRPSRRLKPALG
jgi:hypothetical protein